MERSRRTNLLSAAVVAAVVLTMATPAMAISLNFVDGNEGFPNDSTLVNDDQIFGANLLVLSGSVTVSGNVDVRATNVVASLTVNVDIPPQTQNLTLVPNPTVIASNPTGTATLITEQEKTLGIGLTELTNADLRDLNVLLLASQAIQTNTVNVTGNASTSILGIPITFGVNVVGNLGGTVNNINFVQDAGTDALVGLGNVNPAPNPPFDETTQYTVSAAGTLGANINAAFNGSLIVDLGILGSFPISLDGLTALDQVIAQSLSLPGVATLTDLEPGVFTGPGRDFQADLGLNLGGLPIPFILSTSVVVPVNLATSTTLADVTAVGTVTLDITTTIVLTGTQYQLQDSVPDVVVPEPSTLWLIAIGALGLVPTFVRRLRRRRS